MGGSTGNFKSFNLPDLCQDITAILNAEKVDRADPGELLGFGCIGGTLRGAASRKSKEPGNVQPPDHTGNRALAYLLVGALSLPGLGKKLGLSYFKSLYPSRPVEAEYLAGLKEAVNKPGVMKSLIGMCLAPRIDNDIQNSKVPALIFFGSKDPDFKNARAEADLVQSKLPSATIKVLEGLGHYPHREQPEAVLPQTLEWLAAHS